MQRHWRKSYLAGCVWVLGLLITPGDRAVADVEVPAIFGSHMVLQRDMKNRVWGKASPGEDVTVTLGDQTHSTQAGADGSWMITLDPLAAGGPHTLTIKGKNTLTFEDVLVGEVWVCSGQSNMQWPVAAATDADLESLSANYPQIRLISVPQVGTQEPQFSFNGSWQLCTPDTAKEFSAVGFLFGRELHGILNVPVGLIDDAWGGSACEAWIRRDILAGDGKYAPLMERWAATEKQHQDLKGQIEALKDSPDKEKYEAERKRLQQLEGQMAGNQRPSNIYNGVLKPTIGYGIRGAIWYQGESNAGRAYQYRDLFPLMIKSWRDEWGIGDFPFYWVQLADFMAEKPQPEESAWAELREAQTMTMGRLPNAGQAVIIDIGEGQDIHPKNKLGVARRLARWALAKDYGVNVPYRSPEYKSMEKQDGKLVLTFDHVGSGLKGFDVPDARGFAVAGEDKKFVWAQAKIVAPDKIEVSAGEVQSPVAARYGWADNPICNVYSKEGLPLTPFRTDDWPGVTAQSQ